MKLTSRQLSLVIIILLASLPLEIEGSMARRFCSGKTSFINEGRCYRLFKEPQNYEDAELICKNRGYVLARIYSTSQLDRLPKKLFGHSGRRKPRELTHDLLLKELFQKKSMPDLSVWVGASDVYHEGRFYWSVDNSELKRYSPLWNKGQPKNTDDGEHCVELQKSQGLNAVNCYKHNYFLCMDLNDGLLSMNVNNTKTSRNQVFHLEKDQRLDIGCDVPHFPDRLALVFNDVLLMSFMRQSLVYNINATTCDHSGTYSCNAIYAGTLVSFYVTIDIVPCSNVSDTNASNYDNGRPVCSGKDTELSGGSCFKYFHGLFTFRNAERLCKQNDGVLAAFKSLSQMQNIFKDLRDGQSVWVGANNLQDSAIFRWIANKKRLGSDSPMWSNKLTTNLGQEICVARSKDLLLFKSQCFPTRNYICLNLYLEAIAVTVNGEPRERNAEIFISKNSTMTIECLAPTTNDSIILSIRLKDHVIMTVSNQSRLVYDVDDAQCENAGRYSCNADFTDTGISVEYFIFIAMDCEVNVTLSINHVITTATHHNLTNVLSILYLTCTVTYAREDFYLEILKNDKVLTTQYDISTVTFNLSVTGCNNSDVYACRYHQYHPEMITKSSPLIMGVNNCPTQILSFEVSDSLMGPNNYEDSDPEILGNSEEEYVEEHYDAVWEMHRRKRSRLVCNAETYSRPTTLLIKSETGNVLKSQENTSVIDVTSSHMTCEDKGKVVCQITDHLRNETDSKSIYTWVRDCKPSLCPNKENFTQLSTHLSHDVTATFCFMMDIPWHRIDAIQLFRDGRLVEMLSTSIHFIDFSPDISDPFKNTLKVTFVNVQVENLGQYLTHIKFVDKTVLTFLITIEDSDSVQSSSHDHPSPFMSYGLPCVIFLLLVAPIVAIYSIAKNAK